MTRCAEASPPASPELRQDARHYGWVFFALSLSNGLLGYLDARDNLTTRWDELTFPLIMGLYFIASVVVTVRPRWIEPVFLMALFPTTIYQVGIFYLAIHEADVASYYSAASGASYFPFVYVGLFIVSARRATLYSALYFCAFCLLAAYSRVSLHETPSFPLRMQSEHLLNAILLSHPIYILALRYIVRLQERLYATRQTIFENKSTFLSMLSHEIRNQLQTIVIAIDRLDMRIRKPENRKSLHRLQTSTEQLQVYLRDVGKLIELENPSLKFSFETFSPYELLLDICDEWSPQAREKGLDLLVAAPSGQDSSASSLGDRTRLRQIIGNLVGNAIKYTQAGRILLSAGGDNDTLRIAVSDTGIGIRPECHQKIFLPHVRGGGSGDNATEGSGLGLAIVERLVRNLGGFVELQSAIGEGATFSVVLPRRHRPCPFI